MNKASPYFLLIIIQNLDKAIKNVILAQKFLEKEGYHPKNVRKVGQKVGQVRQLGPLQYKDF